jgi:methionine synthase II (cobalamin-independent)
VRFLFKISYLHLLSRRIAKDAENALKDSSRSPFKRKLLEAQLKRYRRVSKDLNHHGVIFGDDPILEFSDDDDDDDDDQEETLYDAQQDSDDDDGTLHIHCHTLCLYFLTI